MARNRKGLLVVISAPSGAGKTTVIRRVFELGKGNYEYSISATTRPQRPDEIDEVDYFFMQEDEFNAIRDRGGFVEWAEVHGHHYATPKSKLDTWLEEGKVVFLDLDVNGGLAVKKKYGDDALLIFLKPPSRESLVQRLKNRKTETEAQINKRLQRYPIEMDKSKSYDHVVVNKDLESTAKRIIQLVDEYRLSVQRTKAVNYE